MMVMITWWQGGWTRRKVNRLCGVIYKINRCIPTVCLLYIDNVTQLGMIHHASFAFIIISIYTLVMIKWVSWTKKMRLFDNWTMNAIRSMYYQEYQSVIVQISNCIHIYIIQTGLGYLWSQSHHKYILIPKSIHKSDQ